MRFHFATALALLSAAPLTAQRLRHVAVETPGAFELASSLEQAGYDVVEGSVRLGRLELVVGDVEFDALASRGFALDVLEVGRPFAEKQAELGDPGAERPNYPDLDDVLLEMNQAATAFPSICSLVNLTQTYGAAQTANGRDIFAVKISDNVAFDEDEPAFLAVSTHHCRETVTPLIALEAIDQLTNGYGVNPQITQAVDENEIWIAPVWNPDGYSYVFTNNNLWRKNRRNNGNGTFGVDLNRNYPFGWNAPCGGSTNTGSCTYRGPSAASEPETQLMIAFSADVRFAKVIDFHSSGREILYAYSCNPTPFAAFLRSDGIRISNAAGYNGRFRSPSAEGEHYEWQLAAYGNWAYLLETATAFQPPIASANAEATQVWGGMLAMLNRAIPVSGNVTDACTGLPVEAAITFQNFVYQNGETVSSGGPFGRYDVFLPAGAETITFSAPGYVTQELSVSVTENTAQTFDIPLEPLTTLRIERTLSGGPLGGTYVHVQAPCALAGQTVVVGGSSGGREGRPDLALRAVLDGAGRATLHLAPWRLGDDLQADALRVVLLTDRGPVALPATEQP